MLTDFGETWNVEVDSVYSRPLKRVRNKAAKFLIENLTRGNIAA